MPIWVQLQSRRHHLLPRRHQVRPPQHPLPKNIHVSISCIIIFHINIITLCSCGDDSDDALSSKGGGDVLARGIRKRLRRCCTPLRPRQRSCMCRAFRCPCRTSYLARRSGGYAPAIGDGAAVYLPSPRRCDLYCVLTGPVSTGTSAQCSRASRSDPLTPRPIARNAAAAPGQFS